MRQPLRSYLVPFLDYCEIEKGLANNTQRNYRQYLRVFFDWLDKTHQADLRPSDLTASVCCFEYGGGVQRIVTVELSRKSWNWRGRQRLQIGRRSCTPLEKHCMRWGAGCRSANMPPRSTPSLAGCGMRWFT